LAEEFVECGLAVIDGGSLVVGEGDGGASAPTCCRALTTAARAVISERFTRVIGPDS
jgi:hypothetical protein